MACGSGYIYSEVTVSEAPRSVITAYHRLRSIKAPVCEIDHARMVLVHSLGIKGLPCLHEISSFTLFGKTNKGSHADCVCPDRGSSCIRISIGQVIWNACT
jgi:hypothetical protein